MFRIFGFMKYINILQYVFLDIINKTIPNVENIYSAYYAIAHIKINNYELSKNILVNNYNF